MPKAIGGHAYMPRHTVDHNRAKAAFSLEEAPTVLPTEDSASSQARARQLPLQYQVSLKQLFGVVSQCIGAVGIDKVSPLASISIPNTYYAQTMASPQMGECKPSATSARRYKTSPRKTPASLQHLEVRTAAPARETAILIIVTALYNSHVPSYDLIYRCLVEFDIRLRIFISEKKIQLVSDSAVCDRTFQSPTNRDVPRTEKRVAHNTFGNVPT